MESRKELFEKSKERRQRWFKVAYRRKVRLCDGMFLLAHRARQDGWFQCAMECSCLRNVHDKLGDGKTACEKACAVNFGGLVIGAIVLTCSILSVQSHIDVFILAHGGFRCSVHGPFGSFRSSFAWTRRNLLVLSSSVSPDSSSVRWAGLCHLTLCGRTWISAVVLAITCPGAVSGWFRSCCGSLETPYLVSNAGVRHSLEPTRWLHVHCCNDQWRDNISSNTQTQCVDTSQRALQDHRSLENRAQYELLQRILSNDSRAKYIKGRANQNVKGKDVPCQQWCFIRWESVT